MRIAATLTYGVADNVFTDAYDRAFAWRTAFFNDPALRNASNDQKLRKRFIGAELAVRGVPAALKQLHLVQPGSEARSSNTSTSRLASSAAHAHEPHEGQAQGQSSPSKSLEAAADALAVAGFRGTADEVEWLRARIAARMVESLFRGVSWSS